MLTSEIGTTVTNCSTVTDIQPWYQHKDCESSPYHCRKEEKLYHCFHMIHMEQVQHLTVNANIRNLPTAGLSPTKKRTTDNNAFQKGQALYCCLLLCMWELLALQCTQETLSTQNQCPKKLQMKIKEHFIHGPSSSLIDGALFDFIKAVYIRLLDNSQLLFPIKT